VLNVAHRKTLQDNPLHSAILYQLVSQRRCEISCWKIAQRNSTLNAEKLGGASVDRNI